MDDFYYAYLDRLTALHTDFKKTIADLSPAVLDWVPGADMNSLCVLVVHTAGASRYWIGDVAMGEPSERERAAEFEAKGLSEAELVAKLDAVEQYAQAALARLTPEDLTKICQAPLHKGLDGVPREFPLGWALLHALEHTGLHLGHAEITRQLWDQRGRG